MKKLIVLLLVMISLIGCTHLNDLAIEVTDYITVYEMERFFEEKPDSAFEIHDQNIINEMVAIFNGARKQDGAVDMPDPEYRIDLAERSVFLWVDQQFATVMDTLETETIYSISKKGAERLSKILKHD